MQSKWSVELISWLITALVAALVMIPIHQNFGGNYAFYLTNYINIFLFLTFARYILLLKYAPFSHNSWIKLILLFSCIPLFIFLLDSQYNFLTMLDENGLEPFVLTKNIDTRWEFAKYAKYEFLFFSVGSLMTLIMLPIRMVVSIWRVRNKGTV